MNSNANGPDLLEQTETEDKDIADLKLQSEAHTLHALQQAIAAMPAIDRAKVEATLRKMQNGTLGILGSEIERLASEQRVTARILEETEFAGAESSTCNVND